MHIRSRRSWGAAKPRTEPTPVSSLRTGFYVHHSVTAMPKDYRKLPRRKQLRAEKEHMRYLQDIAFGRGFSDISYNFVLFPSGRVYRGRGWGFLGAHNDGENTTTIGGCAVGNYDVAIPSRKLLDAYVALIKRGRRVGTLSRKCFIKGHRDSDSTACPGENLYNCLRLIRRRVG